MTERLLSLLGIAVLLAIGYAASTDRRRIPWRLVAVGIGLQAYLAIFIVRTDWVPVVLTASAALALLVLAGSLARPDRAGVGLARGAGILGLFAVQIAGMTAAGLAWPLVALASVALLLAVAFVLRGAAATLAGAAGCVLVTAAVWTGTVPRDFVFRGLDGIGTAVTTVIGFARRGVEQVAGPVADLGTFIFMLDVAAIILLFGGLMSVLYHVGVIPWLVGLLARVLHRALGVSGAESLAAASNVFVGQTEAPLIVRPYLARMTRSEITALMAGGFATIAGSVLGIYVLFLAQAGLDRGAADLIAASVMSAPAAFVFAKLFVPETESPETRAAEHMPHERIGVNVLDALAGGVTAALRLAVNVIAMLVVFYALIYMLNAAVDGVASAVLGVEGVTFQTIYAELFRPFALLIGVEWGDTRAVGELLGTKTIFNEFLAYERLGELAGTGALSPRSAVLSTYALCGFANFMSIGIQIAGLSQLAPGRRADFSRLALRAMVAGALACQLTACIVGLIGDF